MFENNLKKSWEEIVTIFDFAAFCYDFLCNNVKDEGMFLAEHIFENEQVQEKNVNLVEFHRFINEMKKLLEKVEASFGLKYIRNEIEVKIEELKAKLKAKGETEEEQLSMAFFILKAIDRYVLANIKENTDAAPLNKKYCVNSYIYLNICNNMIDKAAQSLKYSNVIASKTIRNQLLYLNIVEKKDIPIPNEMEAPKVVPLYISEHDERRNKILVNSKIKVAMIPFAKKQMLEFPIIKGATFKVEYNDWHKEHGKLWALNLLHKAIDEGANIIVFPEYICSEEIQDAIGNRLKELYKKEPQRISELLLVVAGSGWTQDNNNVARIYSYSGYLLGRQYKYESYSDLGNKKLYEALQNRGKETTLVEIPHIGRCLIGICRDICEPPYTYIRRLSEIFSPQFLLVPAWSSSVRNGFQKQFEEIINYNHKTSCMLCNCCESINKFDKFREELGIIVTPYKDKTVITGGSNFLERSEKECANKCDKGGCIFILTLNYSTEAVRKQKILMDCTEFFNT